MIPSPVLIEDWNWASRSFDWRGNRKPLYGRSFKAKQFVKWQYLLLYSALGIMRVSSSAYIYVSGELIRRGQHSRRCKNYGRHRHKHSAATNKVRRRGHVCVSSKWRRCRPCFLFLQGLWIELMHDRRGVTRVWSRIPCIRRIQEGLNSNPIQCPCSDLQIHSRNMFAASSILISLVS